MKPFMAGARLSMRLDLVLNYAGIMMEMPE